MLRRIAFGDGRWVRPGTLARLSLCAALLVLLAADVAFYRWATRSYEPARTIAAASTLLRQPIRLESALDVEWKEAILNAGNAGNWHRLLGPPLPPAVCVPVSVQKPDMRPASNAIARLNDAVRALEVTLRRGAGSERIERHIEALRSIGPLAPSGTADFVLRYNLGRAYHAAGDAPAAAQLIEPAFDGFLARTRLPVTSAAVAQRLGRADPPREETAAMAFHARFLAGAIAYRRGEMNEAIKHFRLAINAVNYITTDDSSGMDGPAHYRRITVVPPGDCASGQDAALTSLDAYAALVAAYMAAPEFTDPGRLPPEVRRTRLQIDPDDPFRPVLRHARAIAGRPASSPIPENLLWAASNLQRVYHHNRIDPDPRLSVTRAVLILQLTSNATWVEAMRASGETDVCTMLARVAATMERDQTMRALAHLPAAAADSAKAAVAIHTVARLQRDCGRDQTPDLGSDVRSTWLLHGRAHIGAGLPGLYEEWRLALEAALRPSSAAQRAAERSASPVLERVNVHARMFGAGRVPSDLPASLGTAAGHKFVTAWRRAVFEDIADALADAGSAGIAPGVRTVALSLAGAGSARLVEIPAGRAAAFLASLESAIAHAGLRPAQVYAPSELAALARSGGTGTLMRYRVRYFVRSFPVAAVAALAGAFALVALLIFAVHVACWRYHLLVRDRLYAAERAHRAARAGGPA